MRTMIYVCSPLRAYNEVSVEQNRQKAREYCRYVYDKGYLPIAPHLYLPQFMDDNNASERMEATETGIDILKHCKELWVYGDYISHGMAAEIHIATLNDIPVRIINDAELKRGIKYDY